MSGLIKKYIKLLKQQRCIKKNLSINFPSTAMKRRGNDNGAHSNTGNFGKSREYLEKAVSVEVVLSTKGLILRAAQGPFWVPQVRVPL